MRTAHAHAHTSDNPHLCANCDELMFAGDGTAKPCNVLVATTYPTELWFGLALATFSFGFNSEKGDETWERNAVEKQGSMESPKVARLESSFRKKSDAGSRARISL